MDDYTAGIKALERAIRESRERFDREQRELEESLAGLRALAARATPKGGHGDSQVRSGQFAGMEISPAAQAYLNARGGREKDVPVDEVVRALQVGRAKMGQPDRQPRNVRIAFTHNPDTFAYDKEKDTVRLR